MAANLEYHRFLCVPLGSGRWAFRFLLTRGGFMSGTQTTYNDKVVRQFAVMTVIWGIVGMLVGVIIAAQLVWPELNIGPWLHFGRLRPLHTNAVIFSFGCFTLFVTSYWCFQRTSHARLWGGPLIPFTFWGWQIIILLAEIT